MRRHDLRLILGVLLVFGGVLSLLEVSGILTNAGGIFWGLLFGAAGVVFLNILLKDHAQWWAAFPAFTLLGLAVSSFLPDSLDVFKGPAFFAGISIGFLWVYFTDTSRWWAVIPAGVLLTLGAVSLFDELYGGETGGFFFIGLGLTFVLVALLPGGKGNSWALIPGAILLVFGAIIGTPYIAFAEYIGPAIFILLGLWLVLRFFRSQSSA